VPDDPSNQRFKGPSAVNFSSEKSSGIVSLQASESVNKIMVELITSNIIGLETQILCSEWMSVKKLHQEGFVKTEVRLYTELEHTHVCSLFIELEKKGGRPPEIGIQNQRKLVKLQKFAIDFEALEILAK
jgi:hypothetical protein